MVKKENDEYLTSAQKRDKKKGEKRKACRNAAKTMKTIVKPKKPRKQGVKIVVKRGDDSDDTGSVTSAASVTTRSGRSVKQVNYKIGRATVRRSTTPGSENSVNVPDDNNEVFIRPTSSLSIENKSKKNKKKTVKENPIDNPSEKIVKKRDTRADSETASVTSGVAGVHSIRDDDASSVTSAATVTTRSGRTVPHIDYNEWNDPDVQPSASKDDSPEYETFEMKKTKKQEATRAAANITSTPRVAAYRNAPESDTDDDQDDIQEPEYRDSITLQENECPTCLALIYENDRTCCGFGRRFLPPMRGLMADLYELFFGNSRESREFRKQILIYNTLYSFASMQSHKLPSAPHGLPVVKIQGAVKSFASNAFPVGTNKKAFGQFYVHTGQEALDLRMKVFDRVDKKIMEKLQKVMDNYNAMAELYETMGKLIKQREDAEKGPGLVRMKIIDACKVDPSKLEGHPGIYRPADHDGDYVAVFYTSTIDQHVDLPGLIIYPRKTDNKPMLPLFYWDPKVSPLCYPLFFPYGEYGFQKDKFPLETDVNKPYWQRYCEYYEQNEEEGKNWEVKVDLVQAKALAEASKNKKQVPIVKEEGSDVEMRSESSENSEDSEENDGQSGEMSEGESPTQGDDLQTLRARKAQRQAEIEDQMDEQMTKEEMEEDMNDAYGVDCDDHEEAGAAISTEEATEIQQLAKYHDDAVQNETVADEEMEEDAQEPGAKKKKIENKGKRNYMTRREYELYRFQRRKDWKNRFAYGGKLSQTYIIQTVTQIYEQRTAVWRSKNSQFLNSNKSKILKALNKKLIKSGKLIGSLASVPGTFPGSPRWLYRHFLNAVTMCNHLGKCDLFITATSNVKWPEIQEKLEPGQTWADAPFLVNQVFREKFKKLMDIILGEKNSQGKRASKGIFGRVRWYTHSIEFQQRGPPHAHCVLALKRKIKTTAQIEKICQAAFPDHPELRKLVEEFMVHKPCEADPTAYCRKDLKEKKQKQCKKGFPKPFSDTTKAGDRHYPELKRPDDDEVSSKNPKADNRYVVPYNGTLLSAWRGHINIEVISSLRVVKYIFKYLFKGFDRALVETVTNLDSLDVSQMTIDGHLIYPKGVTIPTGVLRQRQKEAAALLKSRGISLKDPKTGEKRLVYDEFVLIQDMRALTSCEAAWEIAGYERHGASHVVYEVAVHEEDKEPVRYKIGKQEETAKRIQENGIMTPLKAWFQLNQEDTDARQYNYGQISVFYTYKNGQWVKKKRVLKNALGTVESVNPRWIELFAIRLLSLHCKGVQSFEELRTVAGKVYDTFVEAAKALGLMNDEREWEDCLREGAGKLEPVQLRRLFGQILISNPVNNPRHLWNLFAADFYDRKDFWSVKTKEAQALDHLSSFLASHGQTLADYDLPEVDERYLPKKEDRVDDTCVFSTSWYQKQAHPSKQRLNEQQRPVYDQIFGSIEEGEGKSFFLQGSGGTGKTEIMKALYNNLVANKKNVACVAHTGIAANLLPRGTTAHHKFRIPLILEDDVTLQLELESNEAILLEQLDCVIWDEATMTDVRIYRAIHNHFNTVLHSNEGKLFGGISFVFAGDWKQTLPIIEGIKSVGVLDYTLLRWENFHQIEMAMLTKNMRASKDPAFAAFLEDLGVGNSNVVGTSRRPEDDQVDLTELAKRNCFANSAEEVIKRIFGAKGTPENKLKDFKGSAILTVDNNSKHEYNHQCLDQLLTGQTVSLFSTDEYDDKAGFPALNPESYHQQRPPGMPLHELKLKIGAVVMLMKNVNNYLGLSNGTRLIVKEIGQKIITCIPLVKLPSMPDEIHLSRALFCQHKALSREVAFKRTQFPIQLAFCMTCNKSQGQTLDRVGIIMRTPCFAHGQFYVACSRVRSFTDLVIYNASTDRLWTNNVVYKEIFEELMTKQKGDNSPNGNAFFKKSSFRPTIRCPPSRNQEDQDELPEFDYDAALWKEQEKIMRQITEEIRGISFKTFQGSNGAGTDSEKNFGENYEEDEPMDTTSPNVQAATSRRKTVSSKKRSSIPDTGSIITTVSSTASGKRPRKPSKTVGTVAKRGRPSRKPTGTKTTRTSTRLESSNSSSEIEQDSPVNALPGFEIDNFLRLPNPKFLCFANVTVQSIYRAFKELLFTNSDNNIYQEELRRIIKGKGKFDVVQLLKLTPGIQNSWTDAQGRHHVEMETFSDGKQHDAEELWSTLLELLPSAYIGQLKVEKTYEQVCQGKHGRGKCNTVSNPDPERANYLHIDKTLSSGANLEDYLNAMEEVDKYKTTKNCPACSQRTGKNTDSPHTRRQIIKVPPSTRLCAVKINLHNGDGSFIGRQMGELPDKVQAFGCQWRPIVMIQHTGNSKSGHYIVYVKKEIGWLEIDDKKSFSRHFDRPPHMTNICFVLLEKMEQPTVMEPPKRGKSKLPRKTAKKSTSNEIPTTHFDAETSENFSTASSIPDIIEVRPSNINQRRVTRAQNCPDFSDENCLLLKNPGKCSFANVVVQMAYRMWPDEILKHTGNTDLLAELRRIVTGQGIVDVKNFLHQISEKLRKNKAEQIFDDGQDHTAEDFWATLMIFLPLRFRNMVTFGTYKRYKCGKCKSITRSSPGFAHHLTVEKYGLAEGTPLCQYIMTVESMAVKRQVCHKECLRGKTPYDPDQQHWEQLQVEILPETRFLAVKIQLRHDGEDGNKNFIDREMTAYDNKFKLFGHKWKPIVMIQHIGCEQSRLGGHYTVYLRNSDGWISIDDHDDKAEKMPVNPNMKRICFVILEKLEKK